MIKHFCDCCTDEITGRNEIKFEGSSRLKAMIQRNGVNLGVEVIQSRNGTANTGDFCKYCVLDALYRLDDRPRVACPE